MNPCSIPTSIQMRDRATLQLAQVQDSKVKPLACTRASWVSVYLRGYELNKLCKARQVSLSLISIRPEKIF